MLNKRYAVIAMFFFFIVSGPSFVCRGSLSVEAHEMGEMHQHGAGQHAHSTGDADVVVNLETRPAEIQAGIPATIVFLIKDSEGKPVQDLTITHDRLLHVVMASEDFSVFAHIHPEDFGPITPEMRNAARYSVRYTFPKAGRYLVAVDSAVRDRSFSRHFIIGVKGEPKMGSLQKDFSRKKKFGDYTVTFTSTPERIVAGKEITINYAIQKDGEPVTDLQPYLAAPMHLAVISEDLKDFIHVHGELPGAAAEHSQGGHMHMGVPARFGPEIRAHIVFPKKGVYQIFSEVQHQGRVIAAGFMVEVQ